MRNTYAYYTNVSLYLKLLSIQSRRYCYRIADAVFNVIQLCQAQWRGDCIILEQLLFRNLMVDDYWIY